MKDESTAFHPSSFPVDRGGETAGLVAQPTADGVVLAGCVTYAARGEKRLSPSPSPQLHPPIPLLRSLYLSAPSNPAQRRRIGRKRLPEQRRAPRKDSVSEYVTSEGWTASRFYYLKGLFSA